MDENHEDVLKAIDEAKELLFERVFELGLDTSIVFGPGDIICPVEGNSVYCMANPIIGTEDGYPRRNFQYAYHDVGFNPESTPQAYVAKLGVQVKMSPVPYPQLIIIIDFSGDELVIQDGADH